MLLLPLNGIFCVDSSTKETEELLKENERLQALIQQQTTELQNTQNKIVTSIKTVQIFSVLLCLPLKTID
jgi:hypothetical protein